MPDNAITLNARPAQAAGTTFEIVDNQAVIINLNQGTYVSLNETGSFLWQQLDGETSLDEIALRLAETYQAPPSLTRPDVLSLAQALLDEGMISL